MDCVSLTGAGHSGWPHLCTSTLHTVPCRGGSIEGGSTMCQGDDPTCSEFERHRLDFRTGMAKERRAFLKSGFVASGGAAALATTGISLVSPALAQVSATRMPGQPSLHVLPASAETVHWGYFSRTLQPRLEVNSGDLVTIETLTHHANDDAERMVKGDPGAESVF